MLYLCDRKSLLQMRWKEEIVDCWSGERKHLGEGALNSKLHYYWLNYFVWQLTKTDNILYGLGMSLERMIML